MTTSNTLHLVPKLEVEWACCRQQAGIDCENLFLYSQVACSGAMNNNVVSQKATCISCAVLDCVPLLSCHQSYRSSVLYCQQWVMNIKPKKM